MLRARRTACVVLLWAAFWASLGMGASQDHEDDAGVVGWRLGDDDVEVMDGSAVAAAPAPKASKDVLWLLNGDFELTNVTGNGTVLAPVNDTSIPNWVPGGNGVQILQSSSYQMSSFAPSVFAVHLNNPAATNGTQGSLASLNFTFNPHPSTLYTLQYDCARHPDGPLNLLPTLKVSSMTGLTTNFYTLHKARYNYTDTRRQVTWIRQSFLFMGTGAQNSVKFESMSELYGPVIDNVVLLHGVHILHPNSGAPTPPSMLQRMHPFLTAVSALLLTLNSCCGPTGSLA